MDLPEGCGCFDVFRVIDEARKEADGESRESLPMAWITGAGGLLGHALVEVGRALGVPWILRPLTREEVDLADFRSVEACWNRDRPALVIHCAALSRSPVCQAQPRLAWEQNVEVTRRLVTLAGEAVFVFFSSDLVFDGRKGGYREEDPPNPLNVYGETKAAAEQVVRAHPRHLIVRTSLNGGRSPTGDRGFNEQLRRAWAAGETTSLFVDEYRCPIAATETARRVWQLILRGASGTFHVAGGERLSRWELGCLLAARWLELRPRLQPESLRDYAGPPRPADTSLDCHKAEALLGEPMPKFREWLALQPPGSF